MHTYQDKMTYEIPYRPRAPPEYSRGMFINTSCEQKAVSHYDDMLKKLEKLASVPTYNAELVSIGKSPGYYDNEHALDIWSLHIPSTGKSKQTAFFVSGHHYWELSGPEAVYHVAKGILESDANENPYVKQMRELTHLVFIPQIDVDAFDRLSYAYGYNPREFRIMAYQRYLDENIHPNALECNRILILLGDQNYYHFPDDELDQMDVPEEIRKQLYQPSKPVMDSITGIIHNYGPPILACDYHESRKEEGFFALSSDEEPLPAFIHQEVGKSYPLLQGQELESLRSRVLSKREDDKTFSAYMAYLGAHSFTLEPPNNEGEWNLSSLINMSLIATDRILVRYFLGI